MGHIPAPISISDEITNSRTCKSAGTLPTMDAIRAINDRGNGVVRSNSPPVGKYGAFDGAIHGWMDSNSPTQMRTGSSLMGIFEKSPGYVLIPNKKSKRRY